MLWVLDSGSGWMGSGSDVREERRESHFVFFLDFLTAG